MKALLCAAIAFALAGPVAAQPRYDRKLEEAVKTIVAGKIGDIRGSFDFGAEPVMVVVQDGMRARRNAMTRPAAPPEGLVRATERPTRPAAF